MEPKKKKKRKRIKKKNPNIIETSIISLKRDFKETTYESDSEEEKPPKKKRKITNKNNISWFAAGKKVLEATNKPMHYIDIAKEIIEKKYRTLEDGEKIPYHSLNAVLSTGSKKGRTFYVVEKGKGEYGLLKWKGIEDAPVVPQKRKPRKKKKEIPVLKKKKTNLKLLGTQTKTFGSKVGKIQKKKRRLIRRADVEGLPSPEKEKNEKQNFFHKEKVVDNKNRIPKKKIVNIQRIPKKKKSKFSPPIKKSISVIPSVVRPKFNIQNLIPPTTVIPTILEQPKISKEKENRSFVPQPKREVFPEVQSRYRSLQEDSNRYSPNSQSPNNRNSYKNASKYRRNENRNDRDRDYYRNDRNDRNEYNRDNQDYGYDRVRDRYDGRYRR